MMNEQEALKHMVAPSQKRKGIYRNGILQILVTRACNLACHGCTQGSNLGGKPVMITLEEYEQAVVSLKDYFGVVGMFGGCPNVHPKFPELCAILRKHIPFEQRGLWSNNLMGHGKICRETFNPDHSNLNVHCDQAAWDEFWRDWPEARHKLKGLDRDSVHSPPFVSMSDVGIPEEKRWELISRCEINQNWSSYIAPIPGKGLRGFFCEVAGAMAVLHANDPSWPDLGVKIQPGWWKKPMQDFANQVRHYCHRCGVPMNREGQLALGGDHEEVSQVHADIYKPKVKDRRVHLVTVDNLTVKDGGRAIDYLGKGSGGGTAGK
jgi:Radical SAM superfamily